MPGARQQRAAEVDSITVPWVEVGVGKRNLKRVLGILISNWAGEAVQRRDMLSGSLSLRLWNEDDS